MGHEHLDDIKRLITEGKSNGYIMGQFGLTIGAVAGIRHRMNPKNQKPQRKHTIPRVAAPPPPEPAPPKKHRLRIKIERVRPPGPCTILDLKRYDCRWVRDDKLFCGDPQLDGSSYCPTHHKLVYTTPTRSLGGFYRRR